MPERRMVPRWELNCQAQVRWEGREQFVPCEIKDLNYRGFKIRLNQEIPEGASALIFRFSENFSINCTVKFAWSSQAEGKFIYGASFTRLKDADKERLYQFVLQNFPQSIRK